MNNENFQFFTDIRFTSPISLTSKPFPLDRQITMDDLSRPYERYSTNWYKKNICNDINKTVFSNLSTNHGEYCIVDLADARIPLYKANFDGDDETYYVTASEPFDMAYQSNLKYNKLANVSLTKVSPLSIPIEEWEVAIKEYAYRIKQIFPEDKIILLRNFCAEYYQDEMGRLKKFERSDFKYYIWVSKFLFAKLYDLFIKYLPNCKVIDIPNYALASAQNKWGLHPLHMGSDYYKYLLRCIVAYVVPSAHTAENVASLYGEYSERFKMAYEICGLKTFLSNKFITSETSYVDFNIKECNLIQERDIYLYATLLLYKSVQCQLSFTHIHYGINNDELINYFSRNLSQPYKSVWFYPDFINKDIFYIMDSVTMGKGAHEEDFAKIFVSPSQKIVACFNQDLNQWWENLNREQPENCYIVTILYGGIERRMYLYTNTELFEKRNKIVGLFMDSPDDPMSLTITSFDGKA